MDTGGLKFAELSSTVCHSGASSVVCLVAHTLFVIEPLLCLAPGSMAHTGHKGNYAIVQVSEVLIVQ